MSAVQSLAAQTLPSTISTSFQGTAQAFQDSLQGLGLILLMAIVVIYIVLGVLYESFTHPLTILSGLPSAGLGALLTLLLFKTELNLYAFVGVIMLVGLVKKNGIMMVDFAGRGAAAAWQVAHGSDSRSVSRAFPADHDDDHGGARWHPADRTGMGSRCRVAATARPGGGRRLARLAIADALHHTGLLRAIEGARMWLARRRSSEGRIARTEPPRNRWRCGKQVRRLQSGMGMSNYVRKIGPGRQRIRVRLTHSVPACSPRASFWQLVAVPARRMVLEDGGTRQPRRRPGGPRGVDDASTYQRRTTGRSFRHSCIPDQARVSSEVAGIVRDVPVQLGTEVRVGDLLVRIEPRELTLALERAESALRQVEAQLGIDRTQDKQPPPDEQIASVQQAIANRDDARAAFARAQQLSGRGLLSQVDRETAETRLKVAEANYEAAIDNVRSLKASLQDRRASYELAQKKLNDANVRAPVSGSVAERLVQPGNSSARIRRSRPSCR